MNTLDIQMYTNMETLNKKRPYTWPKSRKAGFSLVEVTMALGLVSFCLVAMLGMLPVGLKQERSASEQLAATQLLAAVENDFQNIPEGKNETSKYKINVTSDGGAFCVDDVGAPQAVGNAAYKIWYRLSGADQTARQMHVYITKAQPYVAQATLQAPIQRDVVAEGILLN